LYPAVFLRPFVAKRKQKPPSIKGRTILTPSPCLAYAFTIDSFSKCVIALLNGIDHPTIHDVAIFIGPCENYPGLESGRPLDLQLDA